VDPVRKALIALVVATVVLAAGAVLVAFVNHREARVLAERAVETRAVDQAVALARRAQSERPRSRQDLAAILDDALDDDVAFAALSLPDGTTVVSAGDAPPASRTVLDEALARAGQGPSRLARRTVSIGGEEVVEFAVASPAAGRGLGRRLVERAWRQLLDLEERGGARARVGPPILRLGIRTSPFRGHVVRARLMLLLALVVGPLVVVAAVFAARTGRRATEVRESDARRAHLASLGELAATVAHEIRNPLGAIKGYAQLLEEGVGPEAAKRAASTMREECVRIERTVEQVLGYARDAPPQRAPVDLREVLDAELARHAGDAAERGVRIVRGYGDEKVDIQADRDQIARLIGNLVSNALAASPRDGRVTVALRPSRRHVEVAVADEGPGVAAVDRERVFEPFYTKRAGGTGLGLAVVRRIAEAHGGTVRVDDRPGGGAEFVVRLPRS
jgi:two-component system sensor histidine kinase HydH